MRWHEGMKSPSKCVCDNQRASWVNWVGLLLLVAILWALAGCNSGSDTNSTTVVEKNKNFVRSETDPLLRESIVACADGNQIRIMFGYRSTGAAMAAYTILKPDGTPKRCKLVTEQVSTKYVPE